MRVLAIIPARGGSKRLPGKNIKDFLGKPLIAWSIEFARSLGIFADIHVSTDSPEIAQVCANHGLGVDRLRPSELASDHATSIDVVRDVLRWKESIGDRYDAVALLQPTSPVRLASRWIEASRMLEDDACESVVGVYAAPAHPYLIMGETEDGFLYPWIPDECRSTRSQDFPPAFVISGSLYLTRVNVLMQNGVFISKKCRAVVCTEQVENIDIDTPADWKLAEKIVSEWMEKR